METDTAKLNIKLFGSVTIAEPGSPPVRVPSGKLVALLGALASSPGVAVRRDALASMIWPDLDGASARRNLRQQVFLLKQFLEQFSSDPLVADGETIHIRADLCNTDLQEFCKGVEASDEENWMSAVEARTGPYLEELDDMGTVVHRHQLDEEYASLCFKLVNLRNSQGRLPEAIEFAKRAKSVDPLSERAVFALVRLYSAHRQFATARAEYDALVLRLREEAGARPSISFKDLVQRSGRSPSNVEIEDLTQPASTVHLTPKSKLSASRLALALAGLTLLLVLGVALVRFFRPAPTFDELKSEFGVLSAQEVTSQSRARQAEVLTQIAESAWKDAYLKRENYWQVELAAMMPEIDEVMQWCVKHRPEMALSIGGALERYYLLVNREREWGILLGQALDQSEPERSARYARALYTWAIAEPGATPDVIDKRLGQSLDIYKELGDREGEAQVIRIRGFCKAATFQPVEARKDYEAALALSRQIGFDKGVALSNFCLAVMGRDPRESLDEDTLRRTRHALEAYDGFAKLENVWGIRSSANLIATHGLSLPSNETTMSVLRECRSRLLDAAAVEQSLSNMNGPLQDVSKAVLISMRIGNPEETVRILARPLKEGIGSSLSLLDRYLLQVACAQLSRDTYNAEFGSGDPFEATGTLESQQGAAAASRAKQLARTLSADQIIDRVLK